MEEIKNPTFEIPEENMYALSEKIIVLNKKAKRLKQAAIETRVVATERRKESEIVGEDAAGWPIWRAYYRTYYTVEVIGASPVLPDWEFLGTLQHEETGNIIRSVPGFEIPEGYRQGGQKCDHCNKVRYRKDTYIVRNKVSNQVKQVGHQCVRDFLGHASPQALALFAQFLKEMENCGGEEFGGSGKARSADTLSVLEMAAQVILNYGFTSKAAAQNYASKGGNLPTTSETTWRYLFPTPEMKKTGDLLIVSDEARKLAGETLDWADDLEVKSNYEHNLKLMLAKTYLTQRDLGISVSAVAAYQKAVTIFKAHEKKEKSVSEFFGELKKRYDLILTLKKKISVNSDFGDSFYVLIFEDKSGNVYKWTTGNGFDLYEGGEYKVRGTVKAFATYKDVKQTVITRCSVEDAPKSQDEAAS